MYNVLEEVKSLAVEEDRVYTVKDQDLVISQKTASGKGLVNKATIPGRYPLILCGPKEGNKHKYVIFCTRDGKGLTMIKNETPYTELWSQDVSFEVRGVIVGLIAFLFPELPRHGHQLSVRFRGLGVHWSL